MNPAAPCNSQLILKVGEEPIVLVLSSGEIPCIPCESEFSEC